MSPKIQKRQKVLRVLFVKYNWGYASQDTSFKYHRKYSRDGQRAMGVGSVSSVVVDYLLLLCLERSKVYRQGRIVFYVVCKVSNNSLTVKG